jgi:hypothetical protein
VSPESVKTTHAAAHALGLQLKSLEVQDAKDFEKAFEATLAERLRPFSRTHSPSLILISRESWSLLQRTACQQCTRGESSWMLAA